MSVKPQMWLDSTLPKTQWVPIDPVTDLANYVLYSKLTALVTLYKFSHSDEEEERERLKAEYMALREGVEFREQPAFVRYTFMLGANALTGPKTEMPDLIIGCHPETWAAMPQEQRDLYDVKDLDPAAKRVAGSTINIPL